MPAGVRDWTELLPELLGSISERLPPIEYFCFGAVCSSWAAAADSSCDAPNRPLGMPFLLHLGLDRESCALVDIHDRRTRSIGPLPELRGKQFVGSQDGWIAILDKYSEVSLFNPLTRSRIQLPSVATMPGVEALYNPDGSIKAFIDNILDNGLCTLKQFRLMSFKKIVLSSRPTAHSYTAMAIFSGFNRPAIATAAGGKWTIVKNKLIRDIIYRDGKFLLITHIGELWDLDTATPDPEMRMIAPEIGYEYCSQDKFLVDSSGDLLLVWRLNDPDDDSDDADKTVGFKVMKFNPDQATWATLKSLGDTSLFVGASYSTSLSVREFPMLKPNCIYFNAVLWDLPSGELAHERQLTRDIGVFNMEDGRLDHYCPSDARLNWPPPLWFTPSLL